MNKNISRINFGLALLVLIIFVRAFCINSEAAKGQENFGHKSEIEKSEVKIVNRSEWQKQVEKNFEAKKSGELTGLDKNGKRIIFQYKLASVHEPEYAKEMAAVAEIYGRAMGPIEFEFLKSKPDIDGFYNSYPLVELDVETYNRLKLLFCNGPESVDWTPVKEIIAEKAWAFVGNMGNHKDFKTRFYDSLFLNVVAVDEETGQRLGWICYHVHNIFCNPGQVSLDILAVIPEAQNRGIGKMLASSVYKLIAEVKNIGLCVKTYNEFAIKAYKAWGFFESKYQDQNSFDKSMHYETEKSDILQKVAKALE